MQWMEQEQVKNKYIEYVKYTNADFKELKHSVFFMRLNRQRTKEARSNVAWLYTARESIYNDFHAT